MQRWSFTIEETSISKGRRWRVMNCLSRGIENMTGIVGTKRKKFGWENRKREGIDW